MALNVFTELCSKPRDGCVFSPSFFAGGLVSYACGVAWPADNVNDG